MPKYKVEYSDSVVVEANSEQEAIHEAWQQMFCDGPKDYCFYANEGDDDDEDEDENTKTLPEKNEDEDDDEVPEHILALAADLKSEVEEEIGDGLPWMDNCWNNHSFSYELTRRPAGIKEESCEVNYTAKTYQELLKYEDLNSEEDDDGDDYDFEGEDD